MAKPWARIPMKVAVKNVTGYDIDAITTDEEAISKAKELGIPLDKSKTYTKFGLLNLILKKK